MRTKLSGFLAAVLLLVAGGYFVSRDVSEKREVLMTVVWTVDDARTWAQVRYWINAEPSRIYRPASGRWTERVTVAPGTPVLLRGLMRNAGQMSCLLQVVGGQQDRDLRAGTGEVECKVYA